jgi:hypothetical protein
MPETQELLNSKTSFSLLLVPSQVLSSLNGISETPLDNKELLVCGILTSELEDQRDLNLEHLNATKLSTVLLHHVMLLSCFCI